MILLQWWTELRDWLGALSPEFAFLLALPFVVAVAGLLALWPARQGDSPRIARTDADGRG